MMLNVRTIKDTYKETFKDLWNIQVEKLKVKFGDAISAVRLPPDYPTDVPVLYVKKSELIELLRTLKDDFEYGFLSDITATDEGIEPRFEVVYNLFSHVSKARIRVKVQVTTQEAEGEGVPTAVSLWKGANWVEREVFDMYGVKFQGHPDLRRILMDGRWVGHPLRKDYPLRGYQVFTEPEQVHPELLE